MWKCQFSPKQRSSLQIPGFVTNKNMPPIIFHMPVSRLAPQNTLTMLKVPRMDCICKWNGPAPQLSIHSFNQQFSVHWAAGSVPDSDAMMCRKWPGLTIFKSNTTKAGLDTLNASIPFGANTYGLVSFSKAATFTWNTFHSSVIGSYILRISS